MGWWRDAATSKPTANPHAGPDVPLATKDRQHSTRERHMQTRETDGTRDDEEGDGREDDEGDR